MIAFANELAKKLDSIDRIRRSEGSGLLNPSGPLWDGKSGTIVGCMLQGDDMRLWESDLGLPAWLAALIDGLGVALPAYTVEEMATETILAIPLGADLALAGGWMIECFLNDPKEGVRSLSAEFGLDDLHRQIVDQHLARAHGIDVDTSQWLRLRNIAAHRTEALHGVVARTLGTCLEAACDDPSISPSTVYKTWRCWCEVKERQAARVNGWVAESDMPRTQAELKALHQRAENENMSAKVDVFKLYAQANPEGHAKAMRMQQSEWEARRSAVAACAAMLQSAVTGNAAVRAVN